MTWRRVANVCYIVVFSIYGVGGIILTGLSAHLFGVTTEILNSLNWQQLLRPPILVSLFAIWLPFPAGMAMARRLFDKEYYGGSILASLLTPLVALLLLFFGVALVLLPLGR
jgi:hypothetical protein